MYFACLISAARLASKPALPMYLKSLELIGFKSFAAKTRIEFHRGVTAVVGPNGCGKSNILDAIRWVLGEQSARALRGEGMADVIFNGTDTRPAVSAAEVSLTFADCENDLGTEYNELCLTRRVYRDSQSDFLLNHTPCRLKDIQLLLMDTGIGRSAYSIMEQGKIDLILSSRPEDRRAIFEEAAGISKYKAQKREALRKLEYTEANLLRLSDIVKEVKRQIGSLQRQAGKARRYRALFESLKVLDLHVAARRRADLLAELAEAEGKMLEFAARHRVLEEQVDSQDFGLTAQRGELEALENRLAEARQDAHETRNRITGARTQVGFNEERALESERLSARSAEEMISAKSRLEVEQDELAKIDQQLAELRQNLATSEAALVRRHQEMAQARTEKEAAEERVRECQGRIKKAEAAATNAQTELHRNLDGQRAAEERFDLVSKELVGIEASHCDLCNQVESARSDLEKAAADLQAHRHSANDCQLRREAREREHQDVAASCAKIERLEAEKKARLEVLTQLIEEGQGLHSATQAILKGLDEPERFRPRILGSLAKFVEVPAELVAAVEAALGAHLQAVLLRDPSALDEVAQKLSDGGFGRGAVSLESLATSPDEPGPADPLPEGAIAWLLDRLTIQPEASALLSRLLALVALAADLPAALAMKQRASSGLAVVTMKGEFVSAAGVVFAGSAGDQADSIFQRRLEVRQLQSEIRCVAEQAEVLAASREVAWREVEAAENARRASQNVLEHAQVVTASRQAELSLLERELRERENKLKSLSWEQRVLREGVQERSEHTEALRTRLGELRSELEKATAAHSEAMNAARNVAARELELNDAWQELKIHVATERNRWESLGSVRKPIASRLEELHALVTTREAEIEHYRERIVSLQQANSDLIETIKQLEEDLAAADAQIALLLSERTKRSAAIEAVEVSLRQLRQELLTCGELKGREEVRRTQSQLRLQSLDEHVARRYQVEPGSFEPDWFAFRVALRDQRKRLESSSPSEREEADPSAHEQVDWTFAEAAVAEMTARLDGMGPVNLEAIQEYDELEERQRFLEQQNVDLTKAKAELLEVIQRINRTTKELFRDTFEQVRCNFQEMFVELFGGGKANLLLVDDLDPLESGIEIIAKPPGKQLQSIALLSGGEKTMAAVALLFAIYMVKPSPFCVLDEMDAPLDESNINRFIRILDRFVGQSQFVVITHNKRTIAKADVLYGVTMEEQGISKLVGVRLTRREEGHGEADLIGTRKNVPSIAESLGKGES